VHTLLRARTAALTLLVPVLGILWLLLGAAAASASGTPSLTLTASEPANSLYGSVVPVTLRATNPGGQAYGYNLTFREVLPAGVTYAAGSSTGSGGPVGDPTVIADPVTGAQTLIWTDVGDLSANSSYKISFDLNVNKTVYDVGGAAPGTAGSFTPNAQAYINTDPRYIPKFNADGTPVGPSPTSFTGESPLVPATTKITAIKIDKSGPATLLRGVHDHQGTYDLTVTNNNVNPTNTVTVDDWLPADLEFLGCGGANTDNTTNAVGTNPGSPDEYPGSGPINVNPVAGCVQPTTVETVQTTPPVTDANGNPLPAGVYTHVVWTIGNLTPGQVVKLPYAAAVPIRENTLNWAAATTGTTTTTTAPGTTGPQTANLNNNNGPETYHNEPIVNGSEAQGNYQDAADANASIPVSDTSTLSGVAKDIIIGKAVSSPTLAQGAIPTYTLTVNTSEYRYYNDLTVTDTLPNGQCPLDSTQNFEHQQASDCAPVSGKAPSSEYKSAVEQVGGGGTGDGTYALSWEKSTDGDLGQIPVNGTATITFPARTLRYYQANGQDNTSSPVLSNDSITNSAGVSGTDHVRCTGGSTPQDCAGGSPISHDQTTSNGTTENTIGTGGASAGQAAPGPTIEKQVAAGLPVDGKCSDASYATTLATYKPGDQVCWLLHVSFPAGTDTQVGTLNDFLPNGLTAIAGSTTATANNTVPFSETDNSSAPQLAFTLCPAGSPSGNCGGASGDVARGQTFEVTFASTEGPPAGHPSGDVSGNLMKFSSTNTPGITFPLRAAADFQLSAPTLGLTKAIAAVNGASEPANTKNAVVFGGDTVTYHLAVNNSGTADASKAVVWDELPAGETCADVIPAVSYTCVSATGGVPDHLEFSPVDVNAGATATLSFQVTVPTGANEPSPGQVLTDTAGVTSYQSATNTGTTENYYPTGDLNPAFVLSENAPTANSTASVTLPGATVGKSAKSTIHELSTSDATIGEPIAYTVTTALPAGTTLYGSPTVTDVLPSNVALNGPVSATLDGHALPYNGVTVSTSGNTITASLGTTYAVNVGGDTLVLSFDATVLDSAANKRTNTITNTAALAWNDSSGAAHTLSHAANTTVVEPNLHVAKTDNAGGHLVSPGQAVAFTVTTSNPTAVSDVSPAHDVKVVDAVPAGVTVLNTNSPATAAATGDTVSADGGGGTYDASTRTITWSDTGMLAPGASSALHYTATVDANPASGAQLTNTVTATSSSLPAGTVGERTSQSSTNTGYTATSTDTVTVKGPTIVKTATPASVTIGGTVQYQATVTLPANTVFHDLTVLDTLPNGLAFDGYGQTSCSSGCSPQSLGSTHSSSAGTTAIGWFVGELGPFASPQTIVLGYNAHVGSTFANGSSVVDHNSLVNSATVQTDQTQKITTPPSSPPAASSFQSHYGPATAPVQVIEPKIAIDKQVVDGSSGTPSHTTTAAPEDTLTYSVKVTNTGDAPAYTIQVADAPPAAFSSVTAAQGSGYLTQAWTQANTTMKWAIPGPIAPGASVTLTYTAVIPDGVSDGQTLTNTATVPSFQGLAPGSPNGRSYTNAPSSTDVVTVAAPALTITKVPASPNATAGSGDSYNVTVGNTGHATAHAVTVTDTVPAGMNYAAGSATAGADASFTETSDTSGTGGARVVSWSLGSIPAGGSVAITVPVSFPPSTPDPTTLTNGATAQAPNAPASVTAHGQITVHAGADLEAIKSVATSPIPAGGQDTYTLSAKDLGPSDAQSVTLTDHLPSSETFVSADPGCTNDAATNTVTCQAGTVAAGATSTFHVTVSIDASVTGPISNTVTVASPTHDPNPSNNSATISPDSISQADVSVTKTSDKIQYNGGDTITYRLTAHNAGPAAATNVVVTDPLPKDVTFSSVDPGSPTCTETGATVNCALATLAVGATRVITVTAIANGTPPPAATPGTGDQFVPVSKVEQQVTLTAGQTTTAQLTCGSGYISDGDAKVIAVDQGTGTLASVEILKSKAINPDTYEFTLDNTATGNAQVQLFAVCLPATTTADQNGNAHPLVVGSPVSSTQTLSQGDHTITVDVGNAAVPISPSFQFLAGTGTVQGSEGSSTSSVWTYTVNVTSPMATVELASSPLQVQPGAAGGFTNDLQFTQVSQTVTVPAGQTATQSVICPNGYKGIEATYQLPDGLLLLGDDPEPITRVFLLDNTTGAPITGTLDLLCMADRTGPQVDALAPVLNSGSISETNVDPNPSNNTGTAAIRIDRAVGSGNVTPSPPAPAGTPSPTGTPAPTSTPAPAPTPQSGSGGNPGSGPAPAPGPANPAASRTSSAPPSPVSGSLRLNTGSASIIVRCGQSGPCEGTVQLVLPAVGRTRALTIAIGNYKLSAGTNRTIILRYVSRAAVSHTSGLPAVLSLKLVPTGGRTHVTAVATPRNARRHTPSAGHKKQRPSPR
jgi:fimbrial isopeptide formation D2 family protein/uncharacterized repeat protein (TIGR01451 family)